jgi:hypothetical protein
VSARKPLPDYSALVGRLVVVYVSNSGVYGPVTLVSIEDGWFVIAHANSADRSTVRRRGTVLRPF